MISISPLTPVRSYQLFGLTFENVKTNTGAVFSRPPLFVDFRDVDDQFIFSHIEQLFDSYFWGDIPELPAMLASEHSCKGYRTLIRPMHEHRRSRWEAIRARWLEDTGIDPGTSVAELQDLVDTDVGLVPWAFVRAYLREVLVDRLASDVWLFRAPPYFFEPNAGERALLEPVEALAAELSPHVEPGRPFPKALQARYANLRDQISARGLWASRTGLTRSQLGYLKRWRFDRLSAYRKATTAIDYLPISLEWFRYPPTPPTDFDASSWRHACVRVFENLEIPEGLQRFLDVDVAGHRVTLEARREDGTRPVLVGAVLASERST